MLEVRSARIEQRSGRDLSKLCSLSFTSSLSIDRPLIENNHVSVLPGMLSTVNLRKCVLECGSASCLKVVILNWQYSKMNCSLVTTLNSPMTI